MATILTPSAGQHVAHIRTFKCPGAQVFELPHMFELVGEYFRQAIGAHGEQAIIEIKLVGCWDHARASGQRTPCDGCPGQFLNTRQLLVTQTCTGGSKSGGGARWRLIHGTSGYNHHRNQIKSILAVETFARKWRWRFTGSIDLHATRCSAELAAQ